jgi:WS/DGAT/MGAT family acyltransferase
MARRRSDHPLATPSSTRRLCAEDAVFIAGETPSMPMHTMGTLILDPSTAPGGSFDYARVIETVKGRIHRMPPFRQRLVLTPLALDRPQLVDDPYFRVENHIHRAALPSPGSLRELAEFVADVASRLLDRSQPLWEMWLVEGVEGGCLALVAKLHHCLTDGASGSSQMANLLDLEPEPPAARPAPEWSPEPLPSALRLAQRALTPHLRSPVPLARLLLGTARGVVRRGRVRLDLLREGRRVPPLIELAPRLRMNSAITPRRVAAFGSAPLDDIKFVKSTFGVTVNDAVLAAFTLAFRSYLLAHDDLPEEPILCAVPVSLKSEREKQELSNKVSLMTVRLPTQLSDPEEVVRAVRAESEIAKRVFAAGDDSLLEGWLDLLPSPLVSLGARLFSDLHLADRLPGPYNCIISNMQGPPVPLYFGGARVTALYPMGPIAEGMGANVTLLSNMGRVDVGILACPDTLPDIWDLADGFADAVAELVRAAEKAAAAG